MRDHLTRFSTPIISLYILAFVAACGSGEEASLPQQGQQQRSAHLGLGILIPMDQGEVTGTAVGGVVSTIGDAASQPLALFLPAKAGAGHLELVGSGTKRRVVKIQVSSQAPSAQFAETQRLADENLHAHTEKLTLRRGETRTFDFIQPTGGILLTDPSKVTFHRVNDSVTVIGQSAGITDLTVLNTNNSVLVRFYVTVLP